MHLQSHLVCMVANVIHQGCRIHSPARHVARIFQAHQSRLRVVINLRPDHGLNLFPRQNPIFRPSHARHAAGNRRHRRQLIQIHMRALFANHFVAVMRPHLDPDKVPHAARGDKERRLFPKHFRRPPLQPVDCRVFSVHVIANPRLRHGPPHFHRRPRHRIAPQVHDALRNLSRHLRRHLIRTHPLIPFRHRIIHVFSLLSNLCVLSVLCVKSLFPNSAFLRLLSASALSFASSFPSLHPYFFISSTPRTPHSKHSASPEPAAPSPRRVSPAPPTPTDQIAPLAPRHTPARFAPRRFHPVAATRETIPLPARPLPSTFHAVPRAIARPALPPHKRPHHARSPIAPSPKTNVPQPQIPGTARGASISSYASIQIPALPNSKSRSDDTPRPRATLAPSHKTPPSHLRSARPRRCTSPRLAAIPCRAGCPHQSPASTPKRAPAPAPPILPTTAASFP